MFWCGLPPEDEAMSWASEDTHVDVDVVIVVVESRFSHLLLVQRDNLSLGVKNLGKLSEVKPLLAAAHNEARFETQGQSHQRHIQAAVNSY